MFYLVRPNVDKVDIEAIAGFVLLFKLLKNFLNLICVVKGALNLLNSNILDRAP